MYSPNLLEDEDVIVMEDEELFNMAKALKGYAEATDELPPWEDDVQEVMKCSCRRGDCTSCMGCLIIEGSMTDLFDPNFRMAHLPSTRVKVGRKFLRIDTFDPAEVTDEEELEEHFFENEYHRANSIAQKICPPSYEADDEGEEETDNETLLCV